MGKFFQRERDVPSCRIREASARKPFPTLATPFSGGRQADHPKLLLHRKKRLRERRPELARMASADPKTFSQLLVFAPQTA